MNNLHIILHKDDNGKPSAVENVPEKPYWRDDAIDWKKYETALASAIENRMEIVNPDVAIYRDGDWYCLKGTDKFMNIDELYLWPGMYEKRFQIKESTGEWVVTHELMYSRFPDDRRRIDVYLIAPEPVKKPIFVPEGPDYKIFDTGNIDPFIKGSDNHESLPPSESEAIVFANWISMNSWASMEPGGLWQKYGYGSLASGFHVEKKTTSELYQLFLHRKSPNTP